MTFAPVQPRPWSLRNWGGVVVLILVVQLGLIFLLGSTTPIRPRTSAAGLDLHFAPPATAELRELYDPTLLILPHPQNFSGPVWLGMPPRDLRPFKWAAPAFELPLALNQLGAVFNRLVETNDLNTRRFQGLPKPAPTLPILPPLASGTERSVLQVEGDLAQRRLLAPQQLRSWTNSDILGNTLIRIAVDAEGRTVSPTLVSACGSPEADRYAIEQARRVRFEPLGRNPLATASRPAVRLTWGNMVFRWHTIPTPPAGAPAASP
jgi:hypothetical protein